MPESIVADATTDAADQDGGGILPTTARTKNDGIKNDVREGGDGDGEDTSVPATTTTDDERHNMIQVCEQLPSLQECYNFVCDDTCGAVSTFVGTTRNHFQGKRVTKLSYEGYVPMAMKELRTLCHDTRLQYPSIHKIATVHILGDCPVGHASVILAVSSPHRKDAIRAIEYLIDELKARVPIWKLEVYEGDNNCTWKENIEWHQGKRRRVMIQQQQSQSQQQSSEQATDGNTKDPQVSANNGDE